MSQKTLSGIAKLRETADKPSDNSIYSSLGLCPFTYKYTYIFMIEAALIILKMYAFSFSSIRACCVFLYIR